MKNVVCGVTKNVFNSCIGSLLICRPCQNKRNDHFDNIWHQFPFADDFFEDRDVPFDEQTYFDLANQIQLIIEKFLINVVL